MSTMSGPFVGGGTEGSARRGPKPVWQPPYAPGLKEPELEESAPEAETPVSDPNRMVEPTRTAAPPTVAPVESPTEVPYEEGGREEEEDAEEEIEYPDYIFGPTDEEVEPSVEEVADVSGMTGEPVATSGLEEPADLEAGFQEAPDLETPGELARGARDLLDGPLGPELRELMARLEDLPTSEAVARAFAAGYRQGQTRGEN